MEVYRKFYVVRMGRMGMDTYFEKLSLGMEYREQGDKGELEIILSVEIMLKKKKIIKNFFVVLVFIE